MSQRLHLTIGEVLSQLREEFPDVSISKIRFLESQGLVEPERTPSGYRKFYDHDVDRLRWILRQQREHFLPLKVIRGRLTGQEVEGGDTDPAGASEAVLLEAVLVGEAVLVEETILVDEAALTEETSLVDAPMPAPPVTVSIGGMPTMSGADTLEDPVATPDAGTVQGAGTVQDAGVLEDAGSPEEADADRSADAVAPNVPERLFASPETAPGAFPRPKPPASRAVSSKPVGPRSAATRAAAAPSTAAGSTAPPPESPVTGTEGTPSGSPDMAAEVEASPAEVSGAPAPSSGGVDPEPPGAGEQPDMYTVAELADTVGCTPQLIRDLKEFGILVPASDVGGKWYFEPTALALARVGARFAELGVEPRHLRTWRNAADREAGLFEQLVMPLLRQRNPQSRRQAAQRLDELSTLGGELRAGLLAEAVRSIK